MLNIVHSQFNNVLTPLRKRKKIPRKSYVLMAICIASASRGPSRCVSKNWWTTGRRKSWSRYAEESYFICFSNHEKQTSGSNCLAILHPPGRKRWGGKEISLQICFFSPWDSLIGGDGSKSTCLLSNSFLCDPIKVEIIFKDLFWG